MQVRRPGLRICLEARGPLGLCAVHNGWSPQAWGATKALTILIGFYPSLPQLSSGPPVLPTPWHPAQTAGLSIGIGESRRGAERTSSCRVTVNTPRALLDAWLFSPYPPRLQTVGCQGPARLSSAYLQTPSKDQSSMALARRPSGSRRRISSRSTSMSPSRASLWSARFRTSSTVPSRAAISAWVAHGRRRRVLPSA